MRKLFFIATLLLALPLVAQAQDAPRAEIFGGYSYLRFNPDGPDNSLDMNGWNASAAVNFTKYAGIVADFSGHYDDFSFVGGKADISGYLFLVGPRFSLRKYERLTPFGHVLLGAARAHLSTQTIAGKIKDSDSAFAMAIGGGLDAKLTKNLAVRIIQTDYVLTRFDDDTQNSLRISTGLVLRLGNQ
ncbi:MAG TPA: outer membrane beta-barrel protein [Blastocatellia bacterium]|nr:outer membrane beta-barrel protein [Blastocatellia bacterium]HMV85079.1 outer membrane beta-barrel protein [Blastocatellia bacterium]HMX29464.1 outer membrane beta-barrel protein [Blastocatellia bacterium]HMY72005.1 outer membrane beta-barrel protein [Blastocatellia bacterium]HMZ19813.1 outer membrane beta-barrel protein [Blastocatellia bacterium]